MTAETLIIHFSVNLVFGVAMGLVIGLIARTRNRFWIGWWVVFSLIATVGLIGSSQSAVNSGQGPINDNLMKTGGLCLLLGPIAILYLFISKKRCPYCGKPVSRQGFKKNVCPSCKEPVNKIHR